MLYICTRNSVKREINMKKITILILALCALNVNAQKTQQTQNDTLQFMTAYRQFAPNNPLT